MVRKRGLGARCSPAAICSLRPPAISNVRARRPARAWRIAPRAFFARAVTPVHGRDEALRALTPARGAGLLRDVVSDSVVENYEGPATLTDRGALRIKTAPDRVDVDVAPAVQPRFLVVNELYHPDWIAEIGGRPVTVYPANVVMRRVLVPVGADHIRFTFRPFARPVTMALS